MIMMEPVRDQNRNLPVYSEENWEVMEVTVKYIIPYNMIKMWNKQDKTFEKKENPLDLYIFLVLNSIKSKAIKTDIMFTWCCY